MVNLSASVKTSANWSAPVKVEDLIATVLLEQYGEPDIGDLAVERVKTQLADTSFTETVDGIEPDVVFDTLYSNVSARRISSNAGVGYQVGWFDSESSRLAAMLEYGVHVDTNLVSRRTLLSPLVRGELSTSFKEECIRSLRRKLETGITSI